MIGIVHHSPPVVSIILERGLFQSEIITVADITSGQWETKAKSFLSSPRDGRQKVLFVEKLASIQAMLRSGFDTSLFKVAVFDTLDILSRVAGVELIDEKMDDTVGSVYRLLPEVLSVGLKSTPTGIVPAVLKASTTEKAPKLSKIQDSASLEEINAAMKNIVEPKADAKPEAKTAKPKPEADKKAAPEQKNPYKAEPKPAPSEPKKKKGALPSHKLF